ncbi:MAG TPA: hypothetical protein VI583_11920 [Cyclobacteriaceae bacterium]|nr:hypothetical protein [Cyclobacteriaceae bacterium]
MNYYLITLRILHIGLGILWAGAIMTFALFIIPTLNSMGAEAGKFMTALNKVARYPMFMSIIATLTIVTGFLLLWKISAGFNSIWMSSHYGITMSTGDVLALIAYSFDITIVMPTSVKLAKAGAEFAASNTPPTPGQISIMTGYRKRIQKVTGLVALLIALSVVCMAIAQYV